MELPKKLGIGGGALFFLGVTFGWIAFPPLLKSQVGAAVKLKKGSETRDHVWTKLPVPLEFKVHLFNVTNPAEIKKGEKPTVQEVGPFFFDEWVEKVDLVDREDDDTVEYSQRVNWIFNPSKSNGLTGNEELVVPHLLMLGIVMSTMRDKPAMIGLAAKAVDSIFKKPENIFVQAKALDIIFGGLPIDCTVKDFAGSAVCSLLKESPDLKADGEDRYLFSLFGHKNGTLNENRIRVIRGIKNVKDVGKVVEFKGEPRLTNWPEDTVCNEFNGTDSTIFHPFLYEDEDVVSFSPDLCRSISARWDGTHSAVGGITANHYTADLGDMSTDPNLKCFCPTEDTCLKKGLYDLFPCVGVPIVASLPHFYKVDESYLTQVNGLRPNKDDHQIDIDFEPMTGMPMSARKRLQFNMFIFPIDKVKIMKTFPTALLPLFWIEEGITLGDEFLDQVRLAYKMMTVVGVMKWLMLVAGLGLGGAGAGLEYKKRQSANKLEISKITPKSVSRTESGQEKKWPLSVSTLQAAQVPPSLDRN